MRITVNKDYKCVREYGTFKELEVWNIISIQGMVVCVRRNNEIYNIDKRVFSVIFENIKK